ncbi:MAG: tRNA-guanine transglycosylase [Oscillospiraceae bacterium]|nr:tRNA-guanine transglycosylase [Oscillospiraceae bacterium]
MRIGKGLFMLAFTAAGGAVVQLPVFVPVYRTDYPFSLFSDEYREAGLSACMMNAFLLYKDRATRARFADGLTLRAHIGGFDGMICTDSGAFQGFRRPLYLKNETIVRFQNQIRADVAAPIDLITPPGDKRTVAEDKMQVSYKRTLAALPLCEYAVLAGIQQGGRFLDLRRRHIRMLAALDMQYYGIGSLVPFFNKKHDLGFCCQVIGDARGAIGPGKPLHVYGAGDPLEIPFLHRAGANVFDSSSYAHFANSGYYMTPYGAVNQADALGRIGYRCPCPVCAEGSPLGAPGAPDCADRLQRHNLHVIFRVVADIRALEDEKSHDAYLADVLQKHMALFPESKLRGSWEKVSERLFA